MATASSSSAAAAAETPRWDEELCVPVNKIAKVMKKALPANGKLSKHGKELVAQCISEFISYITGEASARCLREKRMTMNGEDVIWAMETLGFEEYVEPLKLYLFKYRQYVDCNEMPASTQSKFFAGINGAARGLPGHGSAMEENDDQGQVSQVVVEQKHDPSLEESSYTEGDSMKLGFRVEDCSTLKEKLLGKNTPQEYSAMEEGTTKQCLSSEAYILKVHEKQSSPLEENSAIEDQKKKGALREDNSDMTDSAKQGTSMEDNSILKEYAEPCVMKDSVARLLPDEPQEIGAEGLPLTLS